jgi:hypothetical protein
MLLLETGVRVSSRSARSTTGAVSATLISVSSPEITSFLARLSARDEAAAWLAGELLDAGWSLRSLDGPMQMDVWQLLLDRGTRTVRFGMERGYSDGVHVADHAGAYRPIAEAMSGSATLAEDPAAVLRWLNRRSDLAAP